MSRRRKSLARGFISKQWATFCLPSEKKLSSTIRCEICCPFCRLIKHWRRDERARLSHRFLDRPRVRRSASFARMFLRRLSNGTGDHHTIRQPIGEPITEPGLHFKLPIIQEINRIDKRFLEWDG